MKVISLDSIRNGMVGDPPKGQSACQVGYYFDKHISNKCIFVACPSGYKEEIDSTGYKSCAQVSSSGNFPGQGKTVSSNKLMPGSVVSKSGSGTGIHASNKAASTCANDAPCKPGQTCHYIGFGNCIFSCQCAYGKYLCKQKACPPSQSSTFQIPSGVSISGGASSRPAYTPPSQQKGQQAMPSNGNVQVCYNGLLADPSKNDLIYVPAEYQPAVINAVTAWWQLAGYGDFNSCTSKAVDLFALAKSWVIQKWKGDSHSAASYDWSKVPWPSVPWPAPTGLTVDSCVLKLINSVADSATVPPACSAAQPQANQPQANQPSGQPRQPPNRQARPNPRDQRQLPQRGQPSGQPGGQPGGNVIVQNNAPPPNPFDQSIQQLTPAPIIQTAENAVKANPVAVYASLLAIGSAAGGVAGHMIAGPMSPREDRTKKTLIGVGAGALVGGIIAYITMNSSAPSSSTLCHIVQSKNVQVFLPRKLRQNYLMEIGQLFQKSLDTPLFVVF